MITVRMSEKSYEVCLGLVSSGISGAMYEGKVVEWDECMEELLRALVEITEHATYTASK